MAFFFSATGSTATLSFFPLSSTFLYSLGNTLIKLAVDRGQLSSMPLATSDPVASQNWPRIDFR
ncbi:hypothetical protein BpHYR1_037196 [Brachionus plicatilis]|uniref:Uncharacterized protein n=1 Tax=Brachionus plicatilis TaxID=10195 RepID=A0A3M7SIQ6_BRAPC|nr:hypothetical protein BpHYR1_037196 [Brachionus plicatilis]